MGGRGLQGGRIPKFLFVTKRKRRGPRHGVRFVALVGQPGPNAAWHWGAVLPLISKDFGAHEKAWLPLVHLLQEQRMFQPPDQWVVANCKHPR